MPERWWSSADCAPASELGRACPKDLWLGGAPSDGKVASLTTMSTGHVLSPTATGGEAHNPHAALEWPPLQNQGKEGSGEAGHPRPHGWKMGGAGIQTQHLAVSHT